MNPDQSPLPKLNIFQLIGLISPIITCLAAFTLLNIIVGTSNWFLLHSLLFNAGATDHGYRQRILLDCMQSDFLLPSTSTLTHPYESEELKFLAKIVDLLQKMCKLGFEKLDKLGEEEDRIQKVLGEIREKQKKIYEEFQKISEEIRQHREAERNEEISKLDEKRKKNDEEHQHLKKAERQYSEELQQIREERTRISEEVHQNIEMYDKFSQEWRRRSIEEELEEERNQNIYRTCREQSRRDDNGYYGDGDSD